MWGTAFSVLQRTAHNQSILCDRRDVDLLVNFLGIRAYSSLGTTELACNSWWSYWELLCPALGVMESDWGRFRPCPGHLLGVWLWGITSPHSVWVYTLYSDGDIDVLGFFENYTICVNLQAQLLAQGGSLKGCFLPNPHPFPILLIQGIRDIDGR